MIEPQTKGSENKTGYPVLDQVDLNYVLDPSGDRNENVPIVLIDKKGIDKVVLMPLSNPSMLTIDDLIKNRTLADLNTDRSSLPILSEQVFEVVDRNQIGYLSNIEADSYGIQRYEEILNDPIDTETLFARTPTYVIVCAWTNSIPEVSQDKFSSSIAIDNDPEVNFTEEKGNEIGSPFS